MFPAIDTAILHKFLQDHVKKSDRFVPGRLQAALALLERLREHPSLSLGPHLSQSGSAGLQGHETYGDRALKRLHLQAINKNHGRRSSNLPGWGQQLLDAIATLGFSNARAEERVHIINEAQQVFATQLRNIIEEAPLEVRLRDRTAETIMRELLLAADEKGKSGEVAQYLVGAKLALRFNRSIPVYPANKSDRSSHFDPAPRLGDYEIENAVIEVAVGLPDEKHLRQIAEIQEKSDAEVWLLTRSDRVETWQRELTNEEDLEIKRVVVTSVEAFVGQNITELGQFSAKGKTEQLKALFDLYNTRWIAKVGTPGIKIVPK